MIGISNVSVHQLALGVLNINLGTAVVRFPDSCTAHPSRWAIVSLIGSSVDEGAKRYFPFEVLYDLWEKVMVPVLQNPEYQVFTLRGRNLMNQSCLKNQDYTPLIERIEQGIIDKMREQGIVP